MSDDKETTQASNICDVCGCPKARWLRTSTVARVFGATPKKVRRMIKVGDLAAIRFGNEWRIDHEALDAYVRDKSIRYAT